MKTDSEADRDVSIEPYMAQGDEYQAEEEAPDEPMPIQTGEPVESILWPPRVLEGQPLTFILRDVRDPALQPGPLGVAPPVISPASSAGSENILFEPVLSFEDTARGCSDSRLIHQIPCWILPGRHHSVHNGYCGNLSRSSRWDV